MDDPLNQVPSSRFLAGFFPNNDKVDNDVLARVRSYTSKQQRNVDLGSEEDYWSYKVGDGINNGFKYDLPSVEYAFGHDYPNIHGWMGSGSPKSTLSREESGEGLSPKLPSWGRQRSSPPPSSSLPINESVGNTSPYTYSFVSWQQFREIQLKKQELISKQIAGVWEGQQVGIDGEVVGLSPSVWPSLQQATLLKQCKKKHQIMSQPKPLSIIGAQNGKTERPGTGVFLPDTHQKPPPPSLPQKKKAQPVLIPAKMVQALNVNMDEIKSKAQHQLQLTSPRGICLNGASKLKRKNQQNGTTQKASPPQDTRLPPDWVY